MKPYPKSVQETIEALIEKGMTKQEAIAEVERILCVRIPEYILETIKGA